MVSGNLAMGGYGYGYGSKNYGSKGYGGGYGGYGGGYSSKGYGGGYGGGYGPKNKRGGGECACPSCRRSMYKYLALAMALFVALASPAAFRLTASVLGSAVAVNGTPKLLGLVLHAVVYAAALKAAKKMVK